ncbi:hypothetical protein AAC387_Pa03g3982 [Persea americana]
MFYSHTFLSRKGPLANVWIAAHLQHKLRKSQVADINISTSVDYIMFPEVPMALRLSGSLLLGVVRIYSRKVNYLYHDCNEAVTRMRTAFASIQVNLPEDAVQAPFHSITLPERFELDTLDIDSIYYDEAPDDHLGTYEEITIKEKISGDGNPYAAFCVDEDALMDTSQTGTSGSPGQRAEPMDEDFLHLFPGSKDVDIVDSTPSNREDECSHKNNEERLSSDLPEIEILRDFVQPQPFEGEDLPAWHGVDNDTVEHHEPFSPTINLKENHSPTTKELSLSGVGSLPFPSNSIPVTPVSTEEHRVSDLPLPSHSHSMLVTPGSTEGLGVSDLRVPSGPVFAEIAIQPTSSKEKQKAKSRKTTQFFDESLVLNNELVKKQLQDTSKLLRKRKNLPLTAPDVWKSYKRLRIEQLFVEHTMNGVCDYLHEFLRKSFYRVDPNLTGDLPEFGDAESPCGTPTFEMDIEHPRSKEERVDGAIPESMPFPSGGEEFTPVFSDNLGSVPPQTGKSMESEVLLTPKSIPSGLDDPKSETPILLSDRPLHVGGTLTPDLLHSAEAEVLNFLESDNTQDGHEDEACTLPVRTRAVAQYLRIQSPDVSLGQSGDSRHLSLNKILEGKTRKQCARVLFETLVLVTCKFVNLQQEEAYGFVHLCAQSWVSDVASTIVAYLEI